jgi:protein arginine kinase
MGMSTRGFLGECSDVIGNFFQLSNQATMGAHEDEFLKDTHAIINKITRYEHEARQRILKEAKHELTDKIYRSYGILKYARTLAVDEFLNLTSALRLGIECNIISGMDIETLNRMILLCLPAHMELFFKKRMAEDTINVVRANLVKKFLPII